MNTITIYRHKTHKDIYLVRNWNYCGGGPNTPFYVATKNFNLAVENVMKGENFLHWANGFIGKNGKTELVAKIKLSKEMEFDGYKGVLTKEESYPVYEFEPITLVEPE